MNIVRVTEKTYTKMLEVLPPALFLSNGSLSGFLVGEPMDHNSEGRPRYQAFIERKTEEKPEFFGLERMTAKEFEDFLYSEDANEKLDDATIPEELQKRLDLMESYDEEAIDAYISLGFETGDSLENFEEAYSGKFDSNEDFAQNMAEEIGAINRDASWPNNCIDWEQAAREIMYDYVEEGGYYFRNV